MPADILAAAVDLFAEQGFERASMRELAARAGCSPANLYHHYRSKYQIFATIIEGAMRLHLDGLAAALAAESDPVEQLRHVLRHHLLLHMRRPEVKLLRADFHPLCGAELRRFVAQRDEYEHGVREIVARACEQSRMSVGDPKLAVMAALAACTQVDAWYRPDGPLASDEVARRITEFLLAGFGARVDEGAPL